MSAPIVVKLGGLAVESPERAAPLLCALAEASRTLPIILVHGGGKAVDDHLARLGIVSTRVDGLRVTTDAEIDEVVAVLAGKVNKAIVGALIAHGARAVGLTLSDGASARAARLSDAEAEESSTKPRVAPDVGRVGRITSGDPTLLHLLLQNHFLPVLAPIAFDSSGCPLNINADDAAAGITAIVGARLLILLTDVPAVLDADKKPISRLDRARAEALIESGVIFGGMIPKVRAALNAADRAQVPTAIASWSEPDAVSSLLQGEPQGTRFSPSQEKA